MKAKGWGVCRDCCGQGRRGAYICFCETNPPFLRHKFLISYLLQDAYVVCRGFLQVGSFWKTNPPGGCFRGVFDKRMALFSKTKSEYRLPHLHLPMMVCRIRTRPTLGGHVPVTESGGGDRMRSCEHGKVFSVAP